MENRQLEDSEFETELMTVNDSRKRQRNQLYASNSYANAYNNDSFMSNHIGNNSTIEHNSLMSSFGIGERYGNHNNHNISNVNDSSTQLINNSNESSINESIVGNVDVEEFNVHIGCNREDVNRNPMSFNLHPYENKEVVIKGLDRATWRAYVNPISGCIYFLHLATNYKQDNVPPGFADNPLPQSTQPELSRDSVSMSDETSSDRTDGSIQAKNDSHSTITSNSISDSNKSSDDSMTSFPNASSMDTSENPDITNTNQRSD